MKDLLRDLERFGDEESPGTFDPEAFFSVSETKPVDTSNPFDSENLNKVSEQIESKLEGEGSTQANAQSSFMEEMNEAVNQEKIGIDDTLTEWTIEEVEEAEGGFDLGDNVTTNGAPERPPSSVNRPFIGEEIFAEGSGVKIVEADSPTKPYVDNGVTLSADQVNPNQTAFDFGEDKPVQPTTIDDEVHKLLAEVATPESPSEVVKMLDQNQNNRVSLEGNQAAIIIEDEPAGDGIIIDDSPQDMIYDYEQRTAQSQINASYGGGQQSTNYGNQALTEPTPPPQEEQQGPALNLAEDRRININGFQHGAHIQGDVFIKSAYVNAYSNNTKKKIDVYLSIYGNVVIKATQFNLPMTFTKEQADSLAGVYTAISGKWDTFNNEPKITIFGWNDPVGVKQPAMGGLSVIETNVGNSNLPPVASSPQPQQQPVQQAQQPVQQAQYAQNQPQEYHSTHNPTMGALTYLINSIQGQHLRSLISALLTDDVMSYMQSQTVKSKALNYLDQTVRLTQVVDGLIFKGPFNRDEMITSAILYYVGIDKVDPSVIFDGTPYIGMKSYDCVRDYAIRNQATLGQEGLTSLRNILNTLYTSVVTDVTKLSTQGEVLFSKALSII